MEYHIEPSSNTLVALSDSTSAEQFEELTETIMAVPAESVTRPTLSLKTYAIEAEALIPIVNYHKEPLAAKQFDTRLLSSIETLVGAYRHTEKRIERAIDLYEARRMRWKGLASIAFELRNDILAEFRFVAHGNENITNMLKNIGKDASIAGVIEDLHILAHPTEFFSKDLAAINFEFDQLRHAANLGSEMGKIQQEVQLQRSAVSEERIIRDKVVTLLMAEVEAVKRWVTLVFKKEQKILDTFMGQFKRMQGTKKRYRHETIELEPLESGDGASIGGVA
ncbi:MAG: hypothetical protein OCD01_13860 [Fibrobacterales bacterium]